MDNLRTWFEKHLDWMDTQMATQDSLRDSLGYHPSSRLALTLTGADDQALVADTAEKAPAEGVVSWGQSLKLSIQGGNDTDGTAVLYVNGRRTSETAMTANTTITVDVPAASLTAGFGEKNVLEVQIEKADGTINASRYVTVLVEAPADVDTDSFYAEPVRWAMAEGITTGTTRTTFDPNGACMRAVAVTFLWRAAGSPEPVAAVNPFADVQESDFYYKAVLGAVENGITYGLTEDRFGPYALCNRAQIVTFLWRAEGQPDASAKAAFTDVQDGQFYTTAVAWAVENGITNGVSKTAFGRENVCNRAQIVTFLYRAQA